MVSTTKCSNECLKNIQHEVCQNEKTGVFGQPVGVLLGNNVVIGRNTRIECTGSIQHLGVGVKIGNRTTFGNDCFFGAAGRIEIGDDVVAG